VYHRAIQINHQPDATIFQFIMLTFIYSSTCFGRFPAHHQELNDCSGSLWLYLRIVVAVGRPRLRWLDQEEEDLKKMKVSNWRENCKDRRLWNEIVKQAKTHQGL